MSPGTPSETQELLSGSGRYLKMSKIWEYEMQYDPYPRRILVDESSNIMTSRI
jgi:hypothetical protein